MGCTKIGMIKQLTLKKQSTTGFGFNFEPHQFLKYFPVDFFFDNIFTSSQISNNHESFGPQNFGRFA